MRQYFALLKIVASKLPPENTHETTAAQPKASAQMKPSGSAASAQPDLARAPPAASPKAASPRTRRRSKTPPSTGPIVVHFVVHCRAVRSHELVFLTGSNPRLGSWRPDQAVELVQDRQNENLWRTKLELCGEETRDLLKFRYFIGHYLQAGGEHPKQRVISRWESQRGARTILPSVEAHHGECRAKHIDEFGIYGGKEILSDGWLNHKNQSEILLRLYGDALKFYKPRHAKKTYYLKVTAFDLRHKEVGTDDEVEDGEVHSPLPSLPSFSPTDLAVLSQDDPQFRVQKAQGELFRNGDDYFVFRTQSVAVEFLAFRVEFFAEKRKPGTLSSDTSSSSETSVRETKRSAARPAELISARAVDLPASASAVPAPAPAPAPPPRFDITPTGSPSSSVSSIRSDAGTPSELATPPSTPPATPLLPVVPSVSFVPDVPKVELERVALAYCMPTAMLDTYGQLIVPILAKTQLPIGQLTIDYLFVRALAQDPAPPLTMETSFCQYWKKRRTIEVGHRGFGNSYTKFSSVRENTIHSLNHAFKKGADFVEFDVQLTKDKTVVIFHDFHVLVSVAKRHPSNHLDLNHADTTPTAGSSGPQRHGNQPKHPPINAEFHEMAVKDLKLKQLQLLHVDHYQALDHQDKLPVTGAAEESPELRPFPTLVEALKYVDKDAGFNIEVKFPMMMKDGVHECANFFERNEYVDIILRAVIENAGTRRIVFSSFEPDICCMIARKQNLFPVLFLCVGATTRYVPFLDKRSSTSITAVNFAVSTKLLGVNFHSEELLRDKRPIQRANHFGLVSFVWDALLLADIQLKLPVPSLNTSNSAAVLQPTQSPDSPSSSSSSLRE
ncbi:hypothetical protein M3Y99_01426700 [Aphelenchoides fujianensis]|nr:hypothetical protein M3Y99_01426700 [Aphelenchoides fujianensis]